MVDTCVCCGDIVPEGTLVCYACRHDSIDVPCPDCGAGLRFMSSGRLFTDKQTLYSRVYHCEKCHADWEAEGTAGEVTSNLKRKFWG